MTKIAVESPDLEKEMRAYLEVNGIEVPENVQLSITLPGAAKAPQRCQSGSGLMTSGGRFFPGYDAKLKAALYAIVRGHPEKVPEELKENGPMYRPLDEWTPEAAQDALRHYGWPQPVAETAAQRKAAARKEEREREKAEAAERGEDGEEGAQASGTSTKAGRRRAAAKARKDAEEAEDE